MNETNTEQRLRLYLIRHGEVEECESGKMLGRTDAPLSEYGLEQSRRLAKKLSAVHLHAIYSSDLQRARLTADTIAIHQRLKVQQSLAWREIDMGEWEDRTLAALHEETPGLIAQLFDDPASFKYPGGESFADFVSRVQTGLDQLLINHGNGEIALVSHGGVCRTIIGGVLGIPTRNWLRLAQDYCCLNVIDWYGGNPVLRMLNVILDSGARSKQTLVRLVHLFRRSEQRIARIVEGWRLGLPCFA